MDKNPSTTSDHKNGLKFQKENSGYFIFQWKYESKKDPLKVVENNDKIEQVMTREEFESNSLFTGKKPSGFFRNIKKRLCVKGLILCRTKKKESSDGGEASWKEYASKENESMKYHTLRRDNTSELHFNNEEETLEYVTKEIDSSIKLQLNNEENNFEDFPMNMNNELESRFDDREMCYGITTNNIAEPQANSSKEMSDMPPNDDDENGNANDVKASLTEELLKLSKYGWYWGPISGDEADAKLVTESDGAFLVRDSSDDRYLLTLSFKSSGKLLHSRMEHSGGLFSLCTEPEGEGFTSVAALINYSMNFSQSAVFCYSRPKYPGHPSFPVRLTKPISRFTQVRSLQYLCRFVIRQNTRLDNIHKLPLPKTIKGYIEEAHY